MLFAVSLKQKLKLKQYTNFCGLELFLDILIRTNPTLPMNYVWPPTPSYCSHCPPPIPPPPPTYLWGRVGNSTSSTLSTAQLQLGGSKHLSMPVNLWLSIDFFKF